MERFKKALLGSTLAIVAMAGFMPAQAYTITSASSLPLITTGNDNGVGFVSNGPRVTNSSTTTFTGAGTGVYSGSVPNLATSPFAGSATPNQDYYVVEPNGSITITYNVARTMFGLLYGTIDSYNSLSFTTTSLTGTETISGATIASALGLSPANGSQTRYVMISGLNSFNTVTATNTTAAAFEFVPAAVPEPVSLALLGSGLAGIGLIRRRKKA